MDIIDRIDVMYDYYAAQAALYNVAYEEAVQRIGLATGIKDINLDALSQAIKEEVYPTLASLGDCMLWHYNYILRHGRMHVTLWQSYLFYLAKEALNDL